MNIKPEIIDEPENYETIKANFADLYHNYPEVYDVFAKNQIMQSPLLDEIEGILTNYNLESGNCLDIGCGTGVMIEQLAQRFPKINFTGIDPAITSLELARKRCRSCENISFEQSTIEALENNNKKFDVVFSTWGHIHWNEKGGIMEQVVHKDGIVILVNNWGEGDDFEKLWPQEPLKIFKTRRELLEKAEYEVKKIDSLLNLENASLFEAMSRIFGERPMKANRKSPFQIGIVLAWKQV